MGNPNMPPMLQQANQLLTDGNYQEAESVFKELAQRAEESFPQRAPFLYIEGGRAAILSGQNKSGVAHLRRGCSSRRYRMDG